MSSGRPAVLRDVAGRIGRCVPGVTSRRLVLAPPALAVVSRLVTSALIPEAQRATVARKLARRLEASARSHEAAVLLRRAAAGVSRPGPRAELVLEADRQLLNLGTIPTDLSHDVRDVLDDADRWLARSRPGKVAALLSQAAAVTFHRTLHLDAPTSPLAADPTAFLSTWHASASYARLTTPRGRTSRARPRPRAAAQSPAADPAPAPPSVRPRRLLFVTFKNWAFLDPLARHYEARAATAGDVEVRRLDLGAAGGEDLPHHPLQPVHLRMADTPPPALDAALAPHLSWADTVFVDWCQRAAVLVTALDPGDARVVVRLHSFEVFTVFPHLVDPSRVDDLVFVGSHIARLAADVVPGLAGGGPGQPDVHVLPNVVELGPFDRPKDDDARFTLAVVGYAAAAKDALWAVDVLAELRRTEPRYRLLLVGHPVPDGSDVSEPVRAYGRALAQRIARPDVAGAVRLVPFTPDVPELLRQVGTIVSSSVRESFHLAVVEGAASRAVPVVRSWPLLARYGGPRELFPADWVVDTPAQAAERIRATTGEVATWRAEGDRARRHVVAAVDFESVRARYDDLLLGPRPTRDHRAGDDRPHRRQEVP